MTKPGWAGWRNGFPGGLGRAVRMLCHWSKRRSRAVAAVEFALTFPAVLYFFAGVTDFGLVYSRQIGLSAAVAAGAQYAALTDQGQVGVSTANVQTVMQNVAAQTIPGASVTASAACYCITGDATTAWTTSSPSAVCTGSGTGACSGTGNPPNTLRYMQVSLSSTYSAILPVFSMVGSPTLSQTTWIPLP
ncbi:MAG TPA: TadE family protein [Acetobacteraceae bacterium]|nr:TadE family protein [Acetobacteraceae bacterium]